MTAFLSCLLEKDVTALEEQFVLFMAGRVDATFRVQDGFCQNPI